MQQAYDTTVKPGTADWGAGEEEEEEEEEEEQKIDYTALAP